jgi:type IX secretion system PorP/SprF family membrane protein
MKKGLRFLMFVLTISFTTNLSAQDIHFSQFYMSPLNLNPALTGVLNCKTRLIVNYRNQWSPALTSNAYNTYSASYDQRVPVGRTDYFGIGGSLWGDVAGASRFGTTQGRLSLSYSKRMGGYRQSAKYLVVGADAGITQRRIREGDLQWPTQHDGNGAFDGGIDPNEPFLQGNNLDFLFADLGAGLLFFNVIDKRNNYYVGLAMAHLNQANVSFYNDVVSLYSRLTVHAGGQFELKPKLSILPGFVGFFQGEQREFNFGTSLRFALGNSRTQAQSWQAGLWYRVGTKDTGGLHSDAVIVSTRFNTGQFGLGFSYDYTVSQFQEAANFNGAFEFSLSYEICGPERRNVYCPRF